MEARYINEADKRYLIIEPDTYDRSYMMGMIENNHIPHLVDTTIIEDGIKYYLKYDISSYITLDDMMQKEKFSIDDIHMLVTGLGNIVSCIKPWMLNENDILLNISYIYVDINSKELYFIYIPGYDRAWHMGISEIFENILSRVDHNDYECVVTAYSLYRQSLQSGCTISELYKAQDIYTKQKIVDENIKLDNIKETEIINEEIQQEDENKIIEKLNKNIFSRFKEMLKIKKSSKKAIETEQEEWEKLFSDDPDVELTTH